MERKVALGARTHLEIDIMNTKYADGYAIVSEDEQALAFLEDWIRFAQELEAKYGLAPRAHDWESIRRFGFLDQDENGSRYELLDGVHLIWKRCHSWGNVIDTTGSEQQPAAARGRARRARPEQLLPGALRPVRGAVERRRGVLLHRLRGPHQDRQRLRERGRGDLAERRLEAAQEGHAGGPPARRVRPLPGREVGSRRPGPVCPALLPLRLW